MSVQAVAQSRPAGICANCFATWRIRRPQPVAIFCWHARTVARPSAKGWKLLENVSRDDLVAMRAEGLL